MGEYLLELRNITKRFPGVLALDKVELKVSPGEVHVIMGENGAGKSTLMKIVDGIYHPDEGEMRLYGAKTVIQSPMDAMRNGIAMIHQELNTVLDMTVSENIFLGREIGRGILYDKKAMKREAQNALQQLGLELDPNLKMRELSVAKRQMVEIAKAVSMKAKVIIMDEPTSAISDKEVDALFRVIGEFRSRGIGIVYISHKMDEIFRIADRITVMRDGKTVGTYEASHLTANELIAKMVGRSIEDVYPPKIPHELGEEILRVKALSSGSLFNGVDFSLRRGEILGIAGLMGAGRSELVETIFGLRRADSGEIYIGSSRLSIKSPRYAIRAGLAFVTEDRAQSGLNLKTTVKKDMSILTLKQFCRWGQVINSRKENEGVDQRIRQLNIKTPSRNQGIRNLSGGNQQKVIIARWLMSNPQILIMDEPTRGIDVGAKYEIYSIMRELAAGGKAILMISSELPEILGICDRTLVMHEGRITGVLKKNEMTQEAIMKYATGLGENIEDAK
ncbi:sugar ABC transporter ATP-binding protein [Lactonifactor longoviformis]|uniref:Monosaccharide ABC transporter ATP-binding protein, CUT2 family (TC 3.A.1.2.-) n=1 Tax=Lactonifactor longoviformis DSM 17459 TaxID=1122155 RepID=A0A1M5AC62_9CLOT|nr:sugar ABC transporter ATP-binding protein [Lactonifactor longoviformis]POP34663.1 sugar ABC transporter ATP-binding protein [Lactonifactor longoviformis]SHF27626.1 monosaccharide ABC transporter ATP-binding protein, CUT2 family (TC 3.A.1.2.-) [Lactonifactor longoviformis DSM 17459]